MKIKHTRVIDWCNHCPSPKSHGQYPWRPTVTCDFCGEEARCDKHIDIGMTRLNVIVPGYLEGDICICTACHLKDSQSKDPMYPKLVNELHKIKDLKREENVFLDYNRRKIMEHSKVFDYLKNKLKPYRKQPKY